MRTATSGGRSESRAFILVHGGFHGGWCYARVADALRASGHRVYTPTLTGLGERSHLARFGVNCSMHIEDVLNLIRWEELEQVVLCGHSYGGIIISAVADRLPERVAALVYLDAGIPEDGKATVDVLTAAERAALLNLAIVDEHGQKMLPPFPAASFNVNEADHKRVDRLCTAQPLATLTEPVKLTGAFLQVPTKIYVRATGWPGTNPQSSYERVKGQAGWKTTELACGHDIMLDAPEELTRILLDAV